MFLFIFCLYLTNKVYCSREKWTRVFVFDHCLSSQRNERNNAKMIFSIFATQQIKLAFWYLNQSHMLPYLHSITWINQALQIKIFNEVRKFARKFLHDPVWLHYFAKENEISLKDIILRILELKFLNHVANRGISLMQFRQLWHLLSARYYQLATRMTLPFEDRYKIIAV